MSQHILIADFLKLYQQLDKSNLNLLRDIYDSHVVFEDPLHRIEGLEMLTRYFKNLYENLNHAEFDIGNAFEQVDKASVYWTMRFSHKSIKRGQLLAVKGNSYLEFKDGKILYHRDFFDAGEMIYQHLPILSSVINFIKWRSAV